MLKKIFFTIIICISCLIGCSSKTDDIPATYVLSEYDDDTEGNSFLVSSLIDFQTITYLEKTNTKKLKKYNEKFFDNNSLLVTKIIDFGELRGITNYSISNNEVSVTIKEKTKSDSQEKKYFFYILEINKSLSKNIENIKIYVGERLLNETKTQSADFYEFLRNFNLNDKKEQLLDYDNLFLEVGHLSFIAPKTNTIKRDLIVKQEFFGINEITTVRPRYLVREDPRPFLGFDIEFEFETKEQAYSIFKKMQKLEFGKKVYDSSTIIIDD